MMKILHYGWLGYKNFGDDLMAEIIYKYLFDDRNDLSVSVLSDRPFSSSYPVKNVWQIKIPRKIKNFLIPFFIKKYDAFLIGGGSILHSDYSIQWKLDYLKHFKKYNNKKAYGINISLGPFPSIATEKKCKKLLDLLDLTSFRDAESYHMAKSMGVEEAKIIQAGDLAGLYDFGELRNNDDINQVAVSFSSAKLNSAVSNCVELLNSLAGKYPKVIVFHLNSSEKASDQAFLEKYADKIDKKVGFVSYTGDLNKFINQLKECDLLIGERYHSIILAYMLGMPFLTTWFDSKKIKDFYSLISANESFVFDIKGDVETIPFLLQKQQNHSLMPKSEFIKLANSNLFVLDELLKHK